MSCWTHITACLSVDTSIIDKKPALKRKVKEYLKDAPVITGSEADADVFVNIQTGHNFSTNRDCDHCKWKDTLRDVTIDGEEYTECDAPNRYNCWGEYQTCIVISIQGDLRDRTKEQTQKEFDAFLKYIEKEYWVRDYSINIEGDC